MNTEEEANKMMSKNSYTKFVLVLTGSFIAMYITMYLNSYEIFLRPAVATYLQGEVSN